MKFCEKNNPSIAYPLFKEKIKDPPKSPKQFIFGKIPRHVFQELNAKWHSRLPLTNNCFEGICFGAYYGGRYYAVAWWSKPIAQNRLKDGKYIYELRRLAICDEAPKNTASRMLSVMEKMLKIEMPWLKKLISYQDTEVHSGTIYKASNWKSASTVNKFISWKNRKDFNRIDQSEAVKVRWEKDL